MKLLLTSFFIYAMLLTNIQAQSDGVTQDSRLMSLGSRPSFQLPIKNADEKTVDKLWKDFVKDKLNAKLKYDKKSKEHMALGISTSLVSGASIDLYSTLLQRGDDVLVTVWLDRGSNFVNAKEDPDGAQNIESFLAEFHDQVEIDKTQKELKVEEDKQKSLEKQLNKLIKDKDGLFKDIAEWEEKIRKAREAIKENENNQAKTKKELELQQKNTEGVQKRLDKIAKPG
jgi:hypothetical protein